MILDIVLLIVALITVGAVWDLYKNEENFIGPSILLILVGMAALHFSDLINPLVIMIIILPFSFLFLIMGLIKPNWILRWGKIKSRKRILKIFGLIPISLFAIAFLYAGIFGATEDQLTNNTKVNQKVVEETNDVKNNETKDSSEMQNNKLEESSPMQKDTDVIKEFIINKSYSEFVSARQIDDWAHGPRYKVITSNDDYIFYLYENKIASVWGSNAAGNFAQLYKKDVVPELPKNVEVEATEELPKYVIIDQM